MHELSIALSLLEVAAEELEKQNGGSRVEALYLRMGALSGIASESLISAYGLACERTPFEGSRLVIEEVPVVIFCARCNAERAVHSVQEICCVECNTPSADIRQGRELLLSALELVE